MTAEVTPDQLTAYLAAVQERWDMAAHTTWQDYATALEHLAKALRSVADVPRLLAAVEAALGLHQPGLFTVEASLLCGRHYNHPYFSITGTEATDLNACTECKAEAWLSCTGCGRAVRFTSCRIRLAITRALLGEDALAASGIELECPSCNTDDPEDFRNGCEDSWHAEARLALLGEDD